jgi:Protein of unknown function (DUF3634)
MTWLLTILALSLLLLPLVISIRRSTELFRVRVRAGKATFVRGRMPPSLLADLSDVVRVPAIERAEIWAVRRSGKARLQTKGELSAEQSQRLRNVIGTYSLQRILAGARPPRRRGK